MASYDAALQAASAAALAAAQAVEAQVPAADADQQQFISLPHTPQHHSSTPQPQQDAHSPDVPFESSQQQENLLEMDAELEHSGPGPPSPNEADSANATAPSLDRLPDDVMLQVRTTWYPSSAFMMLTILHFSQIFTLLDNPWAFSRTSKHFNLVSKDTFFRSRWFLNRYHKYDVIFEAIACGKVFTVDLFERLLRGGGIVSRNLAQLLLVLHTPSHFTNQKFISWGAAISTKAYLAVLSEAIKLVSGSGLSLFLLHCA